MNSKCREIPCFIFEDSNEKISNLKIGEELDILSLPDVDFEVWTEAFITREEENLWYLTDVTYKYMDDQDIEDTLFNKINLEMNVNGKYEVEIKNTKIRVLLRQDYTYKEAYDIWMIVRKEFFDYFYAYQNKKLTIKNREKIEKMFPIYERAKSVIMLELENYSKEIDSDMCNIIDIQGRIKNIDSIEEKVYRKGILSSQVFEEFDDIAGVRVICEYISDVYFLLEYIKNNPLIKIVEIDDKIKTPTEEGYRGIHVIVEVDVYYNKELHNDVKVEIQLRTSFQNGWAMKTHNLTYKRKTNLAQDIAKHMKLLSDTIYEADVKAQELRDLLDTNKKKYEA